MNALSRYEDINYVLISPTELKLPRYVKEEALKKKGIPYTVVETDYSQSDVGQIQTRMAAFVEML